jgi:hypothetical protein
MSSPTVVGSVEIVPAPNSGKATADALGISVEYVLECAWLDTLMTFLGTYSLGDALSDGTYFSPVYDGVLWEKSDLIPLPGGKWQLIVYGGCRNPVYEMDWDDLEKPLESSYYYQAGLLRTDDYFPTYMNGLQQVKAQAQSGQPYSAPYSDGYEDFYADFYDAIAAGETSFVIQAPVFKATTYSATAVDYNADGFATGITGNFNDCTFTSDSINSFYDGAEVPDGWIWRVKSDRNLRQGPNGIYVRVTEYEGADYWDTNIYGDPS